MTETTDPVTKVARDLTEILRLHQALHDQAINHADDPSMPGGESMVALGNVANMEAWANQHQATERHDLGRANYRRAYTSVEDEDPDEAWSAFQLIEFWSEQWRAERGDEYGRRPDITSEASYVRNSLDWAWDNEIHWSNFATDINQARLRLENIVHAGRRADRTRVLCDQTQCVDQAAAKEPPGKPPRLIRVTIGDALDGRDDVFKCPACKHRFGADEFRRAHAKLLHSEGADRYVPKVEALATLVSQGRAKRTVQKWLAPPTKEMDRCQECRRTWEPQEYAACPRKVKRRGEWTGERCGGELSRAWVGNTEAVVLGYCEVATHQTLLWWPDLWSLHLTTRTTRKAAS